MTAASPKRVWLHLPDKFDGAVVEQLYEAIFEQAPGVEILFSAATVPPDALNHHGDCVALPRDNAQGGVEFIKTWQPTVGIWLDGELNPNLLKACANAHVPMHLVDSGSAHKAAKGGMFQRLLGGSALRHFLSVTVGDAKTERALRRAGAAHGTIQTVGLFEKSRPCLPVNEAELDYFAELLSTRPIWLAAQINLVELDVILAAFQQVSRRAHRLILIIVPSDLRDADAFAERLMKSEFNCCRRSSELEPDSETQIYLADTDGEMGLWYRMAPISFIGQTLSGPQDHSPHPFDAAALGSVIVHGPNVGSFPLAYDRLAIARAARLASTQAELAFAIETLLSPDVAAEMANAAWITSTGAAEMIDHVAGLAVQHLPLSERVNA